MRLFSSKSQKRATQPPDYNAAVAGASEELQPAMSDMSRPVQSSSSSDPDATRQIVEESLQDHVSRNTTPAAPLQPVVLAWDPPPVVTFSESSSALGQQDATPEENPPEYDVARRPTQTLVYTFSQLTFNSMVLLPPSDAPDSRPLYHIAHYLNCFMPYSMVTTVRRGGLETGDIVGDFQLGISNCPGTVMLLGTEYPLREVMSRMSIGFNRYAYTWFCPRRPSLFWHEQVSGNKILCWKEDQGKPLAWLHLPSEKMRHGNDLARETKLEVFPQGHEHLDDVIVSALVVQRQRLVKRGKLTDLQEIFNWWPNASYIN